jgi:hypothetical protein
MISRRQGLHYLLAQFHEIEPQYCECPLPAEDAPIEEIQSQLAEIHRKIDHRTERMVNEFIS